MLWPSPATVGSQTGIRAIGEARELVESSYSLRANVIGELLKVCTSVKTVRLRPGAHALGRLAAQRPRHAPRHRENPLYPERRQERQVCRPSTLHPGR